MSILCHLPTILYPFGKHITILGPKIFYQLGKLLLTIHDRSSIIDSYLQAVEENLGSAVDFAQLVKLYGKAEENPDTRYSPAKCLGTKRKRVMGDPDPDHISTSYAEQQNLNIRVRNRRYTRLTSAFSKKAEMLVHSISIMFAYHNFVRVHQTIKTTPAVDSELVERKSTVEAVRTAQNETGQGSTSSRVPRTHPYAYRP